MSFDDRPQPSIQTGIALPGGDIAIKGATVATPATPGVVGQGMSVITINISRIPVVIAQGGFESP